MRINKFTLTKLKDLPDNAEIIVSLPDKAELYTIDKGEFEKDLILSGRPAPGIPRVYRASITQDGGILQADTFENTGAGSGAPFEDSIGGVWTTFAAGEFLYTKAGLFTNSAKINVVFGNNNGRQRPDLKITMSRYDDNSLILRTFIVGSFSPPYAEELPSSNHLKAQPITIEVYP